MLTNTMKTRLMMAGLMTLGGGTAASQVIPGAQAWSPGAVAPVMLVALLVPLLIKTIKAVLFVVLTIVILAVLADAASGGKLREGLNIFGLIHQ